jgi:membrane fusion protein
VEHIPQADEDLPLFRDEVLRRNLYRLEGDVVALHSPWHWGVIGLFAALIGALGLWASLASYSRIHKLQGVVVPQIPVAKVHAPRAGVVERVLVSEGQEVHPGDVLVVFQTPDDAASGTALLDAERALAQQNDDIAREQIRLEAAKSTANRAELEAAIAGLSQQEQRLNRQIAHQTRLVASARSLVDSISTVAAKGYVSRIEVERRQAQLIDAEQRFEALHGELAGTRMEAAKARASLSRLAVEQEQRLASLATSANQARRERSRSEAALTYAVRAPIGGKVTAVLAAPGSVVERTTSLLSIVPSGGALQVEAFAPSQAIAHVRSGLAVAIAYDAFPRDQFGTFPGTITDVSRTVLLPDEAPAPLKLGAPAYRVHVTLRERPGQGGGEPVPLRPGMKAEVSVPTESRSVLGWLVRGFSGR